MSQVQLYVYDLSRGLAKTMSAALIGKQIDVYGREIFYGQGILEARPGTTHHGRPMQIIDCGRTEIDEGTLEEYLVSLSETYTPSAYHLIEFNCNNFTADVVGFLTGGSIPPWISDLPAEFLATPFGQSLKPQIDAMFRRTAPGEHRLGSTAGPSNPLTPPASGTSTPTPSSLLSSIAAQAAAGPTPSPTPPKPSPETSPLILVSSTSNFDSILREHTAVIVNFTNTPGCPPCRAIKPAYESLAAECSSAYVGKGIRFVEVELGIGQGQELASRHGVSATPTFQFFKDGKKVDEMRGATKNSLEARVASFLEGVYPRHAHRKKFLPTIESLPISPITSSIAPKYPAVLSKFHDLAGAKLDAQGRSFLAQQVVPFLEGKEPSAADLKALVVKWTALTKPLLTSLKPEDTFPLIDLWRVALLNAPLSTLLALSLSSGEASTDPITPILALASSTITVQSTSTPKPFLLTILRFLTNLLASLPLANIVLGPTPVIKLQEQTLHILVESLLHPEVGVRSAAAGVAVNVAVWRHRLAKETHTAPEDGTEAEWDVELVSALVEAIGKEADEDVGHRLLVAFAQSLYLSPGFEGSLLPLLEVLGAKETIRHWSKGPKKEVKKLADEVVDKLF